MPVDRLNNAPAVEQTLENAQKFLAILVWKLAPEGVEITTEDIEKFMAENKILFTHGRPRSFYFKMVTQSEAKRIAAHEAATNQGRA